MTPRSEEDIQAGYTRYRGQCQKAVKEIAPHYPRLRIVRGYIWVSAWPSEPQQAHWWLEDTQTGRIIDPTWAQFPFLHKPPKAAYEEWDGSIECDECGKEGQHGDAGWSYDGRYAFCSHECHGRFVGVL